MLCATFLLDEGWVDKADFYLVLGGVDKDAFTFKIITLCLHQVLTLATVLWSPDFVGRRFVLVPEREGRLVWIVRVLEASGHVLIEGRNVLSVQVVQSGHLVAAKNSSVDLDLGEHFMWDWRMGLSH